MAGYSMPRVKVQGAGMRLTCVLLMWTVRFLPLEAIFVMESLQGSGVSISGALSCRSPDSPFKGGSFNRSS